MTGDIRSTLLRILPVLYETHSLDSLPDHLSNLISRVIGVDVVAYNEVNVRKPRIIARMNHPELNNPSFYKAFEAHMNEHPLIRHQRKTGDLSARKISDFLSKDQYHRLALYQNIYRPLGAEDQMALTLHATSDTIVAMAMNRGRRSFTEEHRMILNLLRPHMVRAYQNAEALTGLQTQLAAMQQIFDGMPLGLIVVNQRLRIQFVTGRARKLLKKFFPVHPTQNLPETLRSWLSRIHSHRDKALPDGPNTFSVTRPDARLQVRCIRQIDQQHVFLVLEENGFQQTSVSLQSLGLTPREAEVLLWVSQGKSNPEIAIILDASSRTIQKHLERIFSKLGVESRTAAARCALEVLNPAI